MISVKRSNFILDFFRPACHANPGAEGKRTGSRSRNILLKFSNTSANNNVML